jgi:hypothetical protein
MGGELGAVLHAVQRSAAARKMTRDKSYSLTCWHGAGTMLLCFGGTIRQKLRLAQMLWRWREERQKGRLAAGSKFEPTGRRARVAPMLKLAGLADRVQRPATGTMRGC